MRNVNHIRSFTIMVVVFLLFSSIITSACYAEHLPHTVCTELLTKKHNTHSQSGVEIPYEEREKEEETGPEKSRYILFVICYARQSLQPAPLSVLYSLNTASRSCGYAFAVPLFLAKRTLLI
jgi:hypothetical protein